MIKVLSAAVVIAMICLFMQVYSTSKAQTELKISQAKCDSLQRVSDSFYNELYPCQIEFSRYIDALHIFMKRNPKAADQYATIISEETE